MLKNIDPLLTPELLKILAEMGHEDTIVLADANFTSQRFRQSTTAQTVIQLPGISLLRAAQAVLSVMPLGLASEQPVAYMHVTDSSPDHCNPAQQAVVNHVLADAAHSAIVPQAVERFAFYERAKSAFVIVQTGELAPFANFIFKKGVINAYAGA